MQTYLKYSNFYLNTNENGITKINFDETLNNQNINYFSKYSIDEYIIMIDNSTLNKIHIDYPDNKYIISPNTFFNVFAVDYLKNINKEYEGIKNAYYENQKNILNLLEKYYDNKHLLTNKEKDQFINNLFEKETFYKIQSYIFFAGGILNLKDKYKTKFVYDFICYTENIDLKDKKNKFYKQKLDDLLNSLNILSLNEEIELQDSCKKQMIKYLYQNYILNKEIILSEKSYYKISLNKDFIFDIKINDLLLNNFELKERLDFLSRKIKDNFDFEIQKDIIDNQNVLVVSILSEKNIDKNFIIKTLNELIKYIYIKSNNFEETIKTTIEKIKIDKTLTVLDENNINIKNVKKI